jgi:hypothetical protein
MGKKSHTWAPLRMSLSWLHPCLTAIQRSLFVELDEELGKIFVFCPVMYYNSPTTKNDGLHRTEQVTVFGIKCTIRTVTRAFNTMIVTEPLTNYVLKLLTN